jgi:hypothetical protein
MPEKEPLPEKLRDVNKGEVKKPTVDTVVGAKELSLYQEAAAITGYTVSVLAKEGQDFTHWIEKSKGGENRERMKIERGERVQVTRKLTPGEVAISIKPPQGAIDHSPFWDAYRALQPTPTKQKR